MQTSLSSSTVSQVLASKANTSYRARKKVLACAKKLKVINKIASSRMLLNNLVIFAPQQAFNKQTNIFYFRVIQSISKALSHYKVQLRYCALNKFNSTPSKFLARINKAKTQAAILLSINNPHIHNLAANFSKPCVIINCHNQRMRLPTVAPNHKNISAFASHFLFKIKHRKVINIMCLRQYTIKLQLAKIKKA